MNHTLTHYTYITSLVTIHVSHRCLSGIFDKLIASQDLNLNPEPETLITNPSQGDYHSNTKEKIKQILQSTDTNNALPAADSSTDDVINTLQIDKISTNTILSSDLSVAIAHILQHHTTNTYTINKQQFIDTLFLAIQKRESHIRPFILYFYDKLRRKSKSRCVHWSLYIHVYCIYCCTL